MSAWARSDVARSMAPLMSRTVIGVIAPSISMSATGWGAAARAGAAQSSSRRATGPAKAARLVIPITPRMIARRAGPPPPRLASQRQRREQLEEEVRGEQARDLTGPVVGGRDLHHVGAHEVQ